MDTDAGPEMPTVNAPAAQALETQGITAAQGTSKVESSAGVIIADPVCLSFYACLA